MNKRLVGIVGIVLAITAAWFVWLWTESASYPVQTRRSVRSASGAFNEPQKAITNVAPLHPGHADPTKDVPNCFPPEGWEVTAEFATRSGIPSAVRERINEVFRKTRDQLNELELAHLQIEYEAANKAFFYIEPFSDEGNTLKRRLEQELAEVLDTNTQGFKAIMNSFEGKAYNERGDFGAQSREFKLTTRANPEITLSYTLTERAFLTAGRVFAAEDTRPQGTPVLESEVGFTTPPERFKHLFESAQK